jgi:hypothetical protein
MLLVLVLTGCRAKVDRLSRRSSIAPLTSRTSARCATGAALANAMRSPTTKRTNRTRRLVAEVTCPAEVDAREADPR